MKNKLLISLYLITTLVFSSCAKYAKIPSFNECEIPRAPDYSLLENWAAHPGKNDPSDKYPGKKEFYNNPLAEVDVFFIHPTTYTQQKHIKNCNADITNEQLNQKTDNGSILFQASAFNNGTRVFAPRYRQAHFNSYFTKNKENAKKALEVAYQDVFVAFEYYLKEYNEGRPFIIVGHSQGTTHAIPLIRQCIDGKALQEKLVVAYLVGMPVLKDTFLYIKPCQTPEETGCFTSWRTFKKGTQLKNEKGKEILVTNPVSWKTTTDYIPREYNKPSLLRDFDVIQPNLVDAQVNSTVLWVSKPKFKGSVFLRTNNYHPADINFFYFSIRENVATRIQSYMERINQTKP